MTAAEWMEVYTNTSANGLTAQMIVITMVSGYLVVAYAVGKQLSILQVTVANIVYLGGSGTALLSNYGSVLDGVTARMQAIALEPELPALIGAALNATQWAIIVTGFNACFVVASLVFMWHVRRGGHLD